MLSGPFAEKKARLWQRQISSDRKMILGGKEEGRAEWSPWHPREWLSDKHNGWSKVEIQQ